MSFSKVWKVENENNWRRLSGQLAAYLEEQGCILEDESRFPSEDSQSNLTVFCPGPDQMILGKLSSIPGASLIMGSWIHVVKMLFWSRAQIRFDEEKQEVSFQWIYWTPVQFLLHGIFSLMFILGSPRAWDTSWIALMLFSNALLVFLSFYESSKIVTIWESEFILTVDRSDS